jgi:phosphohistidine phosphatase
MKTLLLMRHAKSAWDDPALVDVLRPLAPRGRLAATRIGRYLREAGLAPERVLCSPALRAAETLARVLVELGGSPVVEEWPDLYFRGWTSLLDAVRGLPEDVGRAMLVCHNPDLHELALALAGVGAPKALAALAAKFPSGALAVLTFPTPDPASGWSGLAPAAGTLQALVRPRDLS